MTTCSFINSQRWGKTKKSLFPLGAVLGALSLGERGCSCNFSRFFFPGKGEVELRDGFMAGAGRRQAGGAVLGQS